MKKSILKMMAEASPEDADKDSSEPQASPLARGRRGSPVISNVGKALNSLSESSITVLDPEKIDASPYNDRFESDSAVAEEIESLAASIKAEGQKIPVLVRPHPKEQGRYQLAYGHRRLAAVRLLAAESETPGEIRVRAYIRPLSDKELLVEQSLENGVRENLTWIEQALWAQQLRAAGFSGVAIEPVLGVSKTPLSLMLKVARALPTDIVRAIGRAKGVGRPKWMSLADACSEGGDAAIKRVRALMDNPAFKSADSAHRVDLALKAARGPSANKDEAETRDISGNGRVLGRVTRSRSGTTISIPGREAAFAEWLETRLDALADEFFSTSSGKNKRKQ
ncbi:plasmid partitioning protein RepB [uncultured Martelella sp.]|uniref:plasmid partitioning protein RepB n=1 Tax=uncultured Martelella sp. TaxID=392331 RepID=UPI0029C8BF3C|nr:plasmid partitioning protein RepB [uncultured Martelella sp.]